MAVEGPGQLGQLPMVALSDTEGWLKPYIPSFIGRVENNQNSVVSRKDEKGTRLLDKTPDAASTVPIRNCFDLLKFLDPDLWHYALVEYLSGISSNTIQQHIS